MVDTGATYVAYLSQLAHKLKPSEGNHCRNQHNECGVIDGVEVSFAQLGNAVWSLQESTFELIHRDIMNDMDVGDDFFERLNGLKDALQERGKGQWFGSHPANVRYVLTWQTKLWTHRKDELWSKEDGLNIPACNKFLDQSEQLQKNIFLLVQLSGGSPSRATEVAVTRVVNDTAASRNVFLSGQQVVMTSFYTKTRSLNDGLNKPIARFPDAVTAGFVLIYLTLVRPLEYCLVRALSHNQEEYGDGFDDCSEQKCSSTHAGVDV